MIWQDVYTTLHGYSGVSALVSTRIYPGIMPQNPTYPAITVNQISMREHPSIDGRSDLRNPMIQIDAWDKTFSSAKTIMAQIQLAIDGSSLFKSIVINEYDGYEYDLLLYRSTVEFSIWAKA